MLKPVIFWGATGQAKVLAEFIESSGYRLVAIFDRDSTLPPPVRGISLMFGESEFLNWRRSWDGNIFGIAAIGGGHGRDRLDRHAFFIEHQVQLATVVHPTAFVASNAVLGPGCQVLAQSALCAETQLGEGCIVNTGASVDHECRIARGCHIAPGAVLAGCVTVGEFSMIGAGAVVLPRIRIGANVLVGAGAVVTRDVPDDAVVYGNPARKVRDNLTRA